MAVRSTMTALIRRVRQLINDPAGSDQKFSDQDIQDTLDSCREDVVHKLLTHHGSYSSSGAYEYLDYSSSQGNWEDGMILQQSSITVTPTISEPITGRWKFAANTAPPVYITGSNYDLYRCAADLLEQLAAQWVLSYDITVDGQSLRRGQAADALQKLAATYRRKQRAIKITAVRSDLTTSAADIYSPGPKAIDYGV